jgi:hypothetical protein
VGSVGIGYVNASVGGIPLTTVTGTGSTAVVVQTGQTDYSSSILSFNYGTKLSKIFRGKGENISFGGRLKYFTQGFSGGGTQRQDALGVGMDADLGFLWQINYWSHLGLTLNNFLPVSFGGKFIWQRNNLIEGIPMSVRGGGRFNLIGSSALKRNMDQELSLLLDYENQAESGRPATWHAGLEYWPASIIALRLGVDQKPRAAEAGIGVDNNLTGGVGICFRGFTFDYAFHQFGDLSDNATHFFSFGYRGDDITKVRHYSPEDETRLSGVPTPTVVPKPALVSYLDLADDYWARKPIEYLATLGIMGGYSDKTFRPEKSVSRGELAVIMVKAKGFDPLQAARQPFKDLPRGDWREPYINTVVQKGYVDGYPDSTYRPDEKVTRAQAAVIFARFSGLYVKSKLEKDAFPDVSRTYWAAPAIAAGRDAGFYEYLSGKSFVPERELTRAEAAEILSKTPAVKTRIKKMLSEG